MIILAEIQGCYVCTRTSDALIQESEQIQRDLVPLPDLDPVGGNVGVLETFKLLKGLTLPADFKMIFSVDHEITGIPGRDLRDVLELIYKKCFPDHSMILSLPIFPEMTADQQNYVIDMIKGFCSENIA